MKFFPIHFVIFIFFLVLTACSKDPIDSRSNTLTSKDWLVNKTELSNSLTNAWEEVLLEECMKDNYFSFQNAGSFSYDFGTKKCFSFEPSSISGTWELTEDEEMLIVRVDSQIEKDTFRIIVLNAQKLVFTSTNDNGDIYQNTYIPR